MPTNETDRPTTWLTKKREGLRYLYERDHYREYVAVRDALLAMTPADWQEYVEYDKDPGYSLLNIVDDLYDGEAHKKAVQVLEL